MKTLLNLSKKHSYHCHEANYYVGYSRKDEWGSRLEFASWSDFLINFCSIQNINQLDHFDFDYNMLFRWDCEAKTIQDLKEDFYNKETNEFYEDDLMEHLQNNRCKFNLDEIKKMKNNEIVTLSLKLFFMHQRKGAYRPVEIYNITEDDEQEILLFLKRAKEYINHLWLLEDNT